MDSQDFTKKPGKAYLQIAKGFAEDVDKSTLNRILENGKLGDIEPLVAIEQPIAAMVRLFKKEMVFTGVRIPHNLYWIMMTSRNPEDELAELKEGLGQLDYPETEKMNLSMIILREIHNKWVEQHQGDFFKSHMLNRRNRFVDFELIGFKEAMVYKPFIDTFFSLLGWKTDRTELRKAYFRMRDAFCIFHGIEQNSEAVVRHICRGIYASLSSSIREVYISNPELVRKIVYRYDIS